MEQDEQQRHDIGSFVGRHINQIAEGGAAPGKVTVEDARRSVIADLMEASKDEVLGRPDAWEQVIQGTMVAEKVYLAALEELLDEYPFIILNRDTRMEYERIQRNMAGTGFGSG